MGLWGKTEEHLRNNECFRQICRRYPWIEVTQPNPWKSPWHWVMTIKGEGPYAENIDVWPHKAKAYSRNGGKAEGWDSIRGLITDAIEANGYGGTYDEVIDR